jgi:drug/metabolite transporter (DMT)-like permease
MSRVPSLAYAFPLTAALLYAVSHVLVRQGVSELATPLAGAAIGLFFGTLAFSMVNIRQLNFSLAARKWAVTVFVVAGILAAVGVALQYTALSMTPVIVVSPLTSTHPLLTLVFFRIFLRRLEPTSPRVTAGAVLVVLGVGAISVGQALA